MQVISDERALAHWRALKWLPVSALNYLQARFFREQPVLASAVLPLPDRTAAGAASSENIPAASESERDDFWRLATTGAVVHEIFCREAGRPLRRLDETEVMSVVGEVTRLFDQLSAADQADKPRATELFTSCRQRPLLTGTLAAHLAEGEISRAEMAGEALRLRILVDGLHRACGDEPATTPRSWDAERIQFALSVQGDPLRREALAACERVRAELVTDFIEELDWWADDPEAALEADGSLGMHAMFLLAKWREASAWPVFRKLYSLPEKTGYDLLSDTITEDGPRLLASVVGKRLDELRALIEDESLDQYCRGSGVDALTCLVAWGELSRAELVAYLRELLTRKLRGVPANEHIFAAAVSAACDLEAWELRPEIEAAFACGVVDEDYIDMEFFLDAEAGKWGSEWQKFCEDHAGIDDVAAETAWLDEPPKEEPLPDEALLPPPKDSFGRIAGFAEPYIAPPKIGRNDPCSCGSGKKFKKCCGK